MFQSGVQGVLILLCALCCSVFSSPALSRDVLVQNSESQASIDAKLIDQGDYYLAPNGRAIRFYRKQDVFALNVSEGEPSQAAALALLKSKYGQHISQEKQNQLGGKVVVRLSSNSSRQRPGVEKQASRFSSDFLVAGNSAVTSADPVLANAQGKGDLVVSNQLLFKLAPGVLPLPAIQQLERVFGVNVKRRLKAPGFQYMAASPAATTTERFALIRRLADHTSVAWAQPQFFSSAFKHSFEPSDPLYERQWHLQNKGFRGSRCDADCDATLAWDIGDANGVGAVSGSGMVIAVIDDGVQLNHEDLSIWQNPGEIGGSVGVDDDGNGYIDDFNGWDFVEDAVNGLVALENGVVCNDGDTSANNGQDNDPSPQPQANCGFAIDQPVAQDNHGTAVAGLAAASSNSTGGVGTAFSASVLPIRLLSDFDGDSSTSFCARLVEAMTYAGRYADVINNSWGMVEGTCPALDDVMALIADGALVENSVDMNNDLVTVGSTIISHRPTLGSPIVFSSGNAASGWVKVTVSGIAGGKRGFEWRLLRSAIPDDFDVGDDNVVYIDEVVFPNDQTADFEGATGLADFTTDCGVNECDDDCLGLEPIDLLEGCPNWSINANPDFVRSGTRSAAIELISDEGNSECAYSYLHREYQGAGGALSFWVWANSDFQVDSDAFQFLVDGEVVLNYADLQTATQNAVGYPANSVVGTLMAPESKVIAVGASTSGDLSGMSSTGLTSESRASYSQFGPTLDVVAPGNDQHLSILTTDRYGVNNPGYNENDDLNADSIADPNYTEFFGGTSAAAPMVAGIAAVMIARNPSLTASEVEQKLKLSADKIGTVAYTGSDIDTANHRNDYHGHGRVNLHKAALLATNTAVPSETSDCAAQSFDYSPAQDLILSLLQTEPVSICPVLGPVFEEEELCIPIKSKNNRAAVICI